jgi:hypothetical protein
VDSDLAKKKNICRKSEETGRHQKTVGMEEGGSAKADRGSERGDRGVEARTERRARSNRGEDRRDGQRRTGATVWRGDEIG